MKKLMVSAALLSVGLLGCPSNTSLCKSGVDRVCERFFECASTEQKAALASRFGSDEADCKTKLYANPLAPAGATGLACDEVKEDQQLCANLGQPTATSFDLGKAASCKDARADLACGEYLNQLLVDPTAAPASCAERCK